MARDAITPVHWETIVERAHQGFCVPFLGAAVNIGCPGYGDEGLPLGGEVALRLMRTMTGIDDITFDQLAHVTTHASLMAYRDLTRLGLQELPRVALRYSAEADAKMFLGKLQSILPDDRRRPSPLLVTLAGLPLQLIVTTNYDRLMERALELLHFEDVVDPLAAGRLLMEERGALFAALRAGVSSDLQELLQGSSNPQILEARLSDAGDPLTITMAARYTASFDAGGVLRPGMFETVVRQAVMEAINLGIQPGDPNALLFTAADVRDLPNGPALQTELAGAPAGLKRIALYRRIVEAAFGASIARVNRPYEVVVQPINGFRGREPNELQDRLASHTGLVLYKLHGSFGHRNEAGECRLVITEEDYIEFLAFVGSNIPPLVKELITDSTLLFLGYGLEDWNFRAIFKGVVETLPRREQRKSFAIQRSPSEFWVDFWGQKQVEIYDLDLCRFAQDLGERYRRFRAAQPPKAGA
jgi:hypothetical protein